MCDGLASESPTYKERIKQIDFSVSIDFLLSICGDVERSSPDAERSPIDEEFV